LTGRARDILDGRQELFWIDDATRTDLAQYPPSIPALVALIYKVTGDQSAYSVQLVIWFADLILSFLLIAGIALTVFGQRAAIASGFLVALSPLFAHVRAYPSADVPDDVVCARRQLVVAPCRTAQECLARARCRCALGIACWLRVNPLYLCVVGPSRCSCESTWSATNEMARAFSWNRVCDRPDRDPQLLVFPTSLRLAARSA
jgi:hypothetical protein